MLGTKSISREAKRCPKCNRQYDDYTMMFCLEDGSPLFTPNDFQAPVTEMINRAEIPTVTAPARVFISYKRGADPDEKVAIEVYEALGLQHEIFIDQKMKVGTRWADCIEGELRRSDFLIVFLSTNSINSEMVLGEIKLAHQLAKDQGGRPAILPVRLDYNGPYPYPLNAILDGIQWLYWSGHDHTQQIINDLKKVLRGGALPEDNRGALDLDKSDDTTLPLPLPQAQPLPLKTPTGTIDWHSEFYVMRESDGIGETAIQPEGVTITIKGPRQMGKTSLLNRVMDAAERQGKRVVFLDFQVLDKSTLSKAELFYPHFCSLLTDKLGFDDRVEEWWSSRPRSPKQQCITYVSDYLLKEVNGPLLLAMDEVDRIFDADFRDDFFSMLRSWHEERPRGSVWKHLDLALVTSTEPYQLIEDLNQSPFNVGEIIELDDFTARQVSELNGRYGSPLNREDEARLMSLLSGHPYLVHRAIYLVASGRSSAHDLFKNAVDERGPFGDHLRHHLFRLYDKRDLVAALRKIIDQGGTLDERVFFRLRGAGLVKRQGRAVVPRCQLYADYFKEYL